jgi:topoisomerase-4 subunit B
VPPLYRLAHGGKVFYARDDRHEDEIMRAEFRANANAEIGRFKGLGEMMCRRSSRRPRWTRPGAPLLKVC